MQKGQGRERYSSDKLMRMFLSDWINRFIIMKKIVFFSFGIRCINQMILFPTISFSLFKFDSFKG